MKDRDSKGKFVHGHEIDLPRDSHGRFMKKDKKKNMGEKLGISTVEDCVDELLKKAGL